MGTGERGSFQASASSVYVKTTPKYLLSTCYLCVSDSDSGPVGFGVMPKEPRKMFH